MTATLNHANLSEREVDGFKHRGQSVIFIEKKVTAKPASPSNAAKATSILYHTYGVESSKAALAIYNRLDTDEDAWTLFPKVFTKDADFGIWQGVEHLKAPDLWEHIVSLAQSIDTCREELE